MRLRSHADPEGKAIFYTMLVLATSHLAISFFVGLMNGDLAVMNMFHILGFDLLVPALGEGSLAAAGGAVFVVALWYSIVLFLKRRASLHKKV